jgi:hypothetical protein
VGLILFVAAFPLLFWNEGRAVKRYKTLKEGGGAVVSVAADSVDPANEGRLVHLTGKAETDDVLTDAAFGVTANAVKLRRTVEMYQWEQNEQSETKKKIGGGTETVTSYTYAKTWSDHAISSADFKKPGHENPGAMPYESEEWVAANVTLGAFSLSRSLVGRISGYEPLPLQGDYPLPAEIGGRARVHNSGLYLGKDPFSPQIGDVRVSFQLVKPTQVSIVSRQVGDTFEPYTASTGGTLELLQLGTRTAEAMFQSAHASNRMLTWLLRVLGFILMLAGLNMIFRPLSVLADVIPFLGTVVGAGTGLIAFLIATGFSAVTIGVAWIVYRPLLGIVLLAVTAGVVAAIVALLKKAGKNG